MGQDGGDTHEITRLLGAIEQEDGRAADRLLPAVYQELRQLAAQKLSRERPGQTLQATALVHEAYLRLVGSDQEWKGRTHFFMAAAEAMRRILIDHARRKDRLRHGGDQQRVDLDPACMAIEGPSEDLVALDEALARFALEDPAKADLVKLRYFAGLTLDQAAQVLGISKATADRYWSYARSWLFHEIKKGA
ncbi:MAG: sigma-70 family RNA polymerase sigma factor [Phycisphaerae bacterium]|nr:sigma-70 family RNA polymerase sigma factor [Phycisphaerae bacterium]